MSDKKILIKKTSAPPPAKVTKTNDSDALSPGDTVEFGLTEHVKANNGRETWIKYGVVSAVRAGESTDEANERIGRHVNQNIQEAVNSL